MTTQQAIKKWCSWDGVFVPAPGEIVIDKHNNKLKIGDGKTDFANLPYLDGEIPEPKLSDKAKEFIENNIQYLEVDDYETFYSHITSVALAREVSKALFKAGLNPKEHLKECPRGCESIFYYEGKDDPNATIKTRVWANPYPSKSKVWTLWDQKLETLQDYIIGYEIEKKAETIKKQLDYLQRWMLEDDE